jgi:hypothetical protein
MGLGPWLAACENVESMDLADWPLNRLKSSISITYPTHC